jgi:ABC-type lipoprotein release transport system permease subunit
MTFFQDILYGLRLMRRAAGFLLTAVFACYITARRVTHLDPAVVLFSE